MDLRFVKSTILVAPLDWGLGHATRCIPIIKELSRTGHQIIIAADGKNKELLQQEFPSLHFIQLEGYAIHYSHKQNLLAFSLLLQAPKMLYRIYAEHHWLKKVVKKYSIDVVISDNRFGLFHEGITTVYITHQLHVKTGNRFSEKFATAWHQWMIKKFNRCWVPDFVDEKYSLAGMLSHPKTKLPGVTYIGALSRFEQTDILQKDIDLLILISGPEPQRTVFEQMLVGQLNSYSGKVILVRGLPGAQQPDNPYLKNKSMVTILNHLSAVELNKAIMRSKLVICRSGYSSVMDLVKLQAKAILVPTPGQPEQEYLAAYLHQKNIFYTEPQKIFNIKSAVEKATQFPYQIPLVDMNLFREAIAQLYTIPS